MLSREPPPDSSDSEVRPGAAEVREQLERMLRGKSFVQARRASKLLRHLVHETLEGRGDRLKGYSVAIEVFGRRADFDSQSDPLVRVEAGRLRSRLAEYYGDEGRDDPVIVEVPRGGYAVRFRYARQKVEPALPVEDTHPATPAVGDDGWRAEPRAPWQPKFKTAAVVALLVVLAAALSFVVGARRGERSVAAVAADGGAPRVLVVPLDALPDDERVSAFAGALHRAIVDHLRGLDRFVIADAANWLQPPGTGASAAPDRQYVLTGNARAVEGRLLVRARVLAAETGERIWEAPFELPLDSIEPAATEEIARQIGAVALPYGPIFEVELARLADSDSAQPRVYECMLRYYAYRRVMDPALHGQALACFQAATQAGAPSADAWAGAALLYVDEYRFGYNAQTQTGPLERVLAALSRAFAIDADNYLANLAVARMHYFLHSGEEFRHSVERVLAMRPEAAEALAILGLFMVVSGQTERGVSLVDRAIELTPNAPGVYQLAHVAAALREGRVEDALGVAERLGTPNWPLGQLYLAAVAGLAGRSELARAARLRLMELDPVLTTDVASAVARLQMEPTLRAKLLNGLNAAGFSAVESRTAE